MEEVNPLIEKMIYLISCALHQTVPEKEQIEGLDLTALYGMAQTHSLTAVVSMALEAADAFSIADPEIKKRWKDAKDKAIRKNLLLDAEREQILAEMEEAGIWYMPLKGSILKDLYPKYGMRQMADNDILYDASRQADLTDLFVRRGYTIKSVGRGVHDSYLKPPVYNFEMHTALFSDTFKKEWAESYCSVKQRLIPDEGKKFGYHFSEEDFYVYIMAHAYKHYSNVGTGFRTLLDTFVLDWKKGDSLDRTYIDSELKKLGIAEFEEQSRIFARKLFGLPEVISVKEFTEAEQKMFAYYCGSATYGTTRIYVKNKLEAIQADEKPISAGTKLRYYCARLFPGRQWCKVPYPFLYRHPYLLPFFWIYRIIRIALFSRKRIGKEIKMVARMRER